MKRLFIHCAAFGAGLMWTSFSLAYQPQVETAVAPTAEPTIRGTMAGYFEDAEKKSEKTLAAPSPAPAEEPAAEPAADSGSADTSCGDEPGCGDEPSCGCEDGCGSGCCFGEPWTLQSELSPCCNEVTYGGWLSIGYYSNNDPLSVRDNDLLSFWDRPNEFNLDQEWFYIEKIADGSGCGWGVGYRLDLMYGVDAQKTQAFGNSGAGGGNGPQGYDNSWDHGAYGWALPQSYVEFANGDLSIKVGHFYTLVGYEVVPKTGNFFYSHSFTQFNSEPFTHTGALAAYKVNDNLTFHLGWTLGWDTGYDQFGSGNAVHSGFIYQVSDDVKYSYMMTAGDLGWRGDGYSHSNVVDVTLNSKWQYVFQSDLLDTTASENFGEALSYGINNYLFYTINDCWKWGTRAEWWKSDQATGQTTSFYEVATGLNYKASANLLIRPEVKFNWTPSEDAYTAATGGDFNDTLFGVDAIYTF
ncbi:MAG: porin [Pirellulales bacterium]|nr:porin [Pirellulales bacterium]